MAVEDEKVVGELVETFDHLDPRLDNEVLHAVYQGLAEGCPVAHSTAHGGFSLLTRFADISSSEKDVATFSSAGGVLHPPHAGRPPSIPIEFDPPEHTRYRNLFMEVLSVPRVRAFEPRLRSLIDEVVDSYRQGDDPDFADRVAMQIPIQAVVRLLGCDPDIGKDFQEFGEAVLRTFGTPAVAEAFQNFGTLVEAEIASRREHPRDDYLTSLTRAEIDGEPLTGAELLNTIQSFVFAGFETTARSMASMTHHLAKHPELQDRLRAEPALMANVVEESLRVFPPVHTMFRTTTCPVEIGGTLLPEGERVALLYGVANRDGEMFDAPDEFRPDRANARRHLAFGAGVHFCAGAPLARAEMRLLLEKLAGLPNYELAGEPGFLPKLMLGQIMGVNHLPLRFVD